MKADIFKFVLSELQRLPGDEEVKRAFEELIRRTALDNGVDLDRQKEWQQRVAYACKLRGLGDDTPTIRERLKSRFQIGDSQAYADISKADADLANASGGVQKTS